MGTAGWVRGGRFDRSRVRWEPLLDDRERLGLVGASWGDCWGDCIVGFGGLFGLVVVMVVMMVVVMVVMVVEEEEEEWLVGWRFWGGGRRDDGDGTLYKRTERDRDSASRDKSISQPLGASDTAAATRGAARHPALTASRIQCQRQRQARVEMGCVRHPLRLPRYIHLPVFVFEH